MESNILIMALQSCFFLYSFIKLSSESPLFFLIKYTIFGKNICGCVYKKRAPHSIIYIGKYELYFFLLWIVTKLIHITEEGIIQSITQKYNSYIGKYPLK